MPAAKPSCFKAYDIRGRVPQELDLDLAYRLGLATAGFLGAGRMCVGHDCRLSSPDLAGAVVRGILDAGCDVLDIGQCGTEMVYWATDRRGLDGGIMVTASHNPMDYNGMKLVREQARPISGDTGLDEIGALVAAGDLPRAARRGVLEHEDVLEHYVGDLLGLFDPAALAPLRIVANGGNGCAGPVARAFAARLPGTWHHLHAEPDGRFPNGIPNPLLPENRAATSEAVRSVGAELGLAWDGDFDRCFFFDAAGDFVEGYYLVGLLARAALRETPGAAIVHDPRLTWNTIDVVRTAGGVPVMNKTGHAFMKERMRREDAIYGGEMSATTTSAASPTATAACCRGSTCGGRCPRPVAASVSWWGRCRRPTRRAGRSTAGWPTPGRPWPRSRPVTRPARWWSTAPTGFPANSPTGDSTCV